MNIGIALLILVSSNSFSHFNLPEAPHVEGSVSEAEMDSCITAGNKGIEDCFYEIKEYRKKAKHIEITQKAYDESSEYIKNLYPKYF